jgi:hypothetical protein
VPQSNGVEATRVEAVQLVTSAADLAGKHLRARQAATIQRPAQIHNEELVRIMPAPLQKHSEAEGHVLHDCSPPPNHTFG